MKKYLFGMIIILTYIVGDFYLQQRELASDFAFETKNLRAGEMLKTHMSRDYGCMVINPASMDEYAAQMFNNPCTNINYYTDGPGLIPLAILIIYILLPFLLPRYKRYFESSTDEQSSFMGSGQVVYGRLYKVALISALVQLPVMTLLYMTAIASMGAPMGVMFTIAFFLPHTITLFLYGRFITKGWGVHKFNLFRFLLLTFLALAPELLLILTIFLSTVWLKG